MKEKINEHDMTKKMMDIIRGDYKPLLEFVNTPSLGSHSTTQTNTNTEDTIDVKPGDALYKEELDAIKAIEPSAYIINFKIYPNDGNNGNVMMEGTCRPGPEDGTGIFFNMTLNNGEAKIEMKGLNDLDDSVSELMKQLQGYYETWCDKWYKKIVTDGYKKQD